VHTSVSRNARSAQALRDLMAQRVLVLDGAWGTRIQDAGLSTRAT
jgi:methionine synthase I (cobalamin-dependent)